MKCSPIAALFVGLAIGGCADESTGIVAADIECPTPQTLTYANFGEAVVSDTCLECHDNHDQRPFLDTQARVQAAAADIIRDAVFSAYMPDEGTMTTELRIQLGQWLTCGAP